MFKRLSFEPNAMIQPRRSVWQLVVVRENDTLTWVEEYLFQRPEKPDEKRMDLQVPYQENAKRRTKPLLVRKSSAAAAIPRGAAA